MELPVRADTKTPVYALCPYRLLSPLICDILPASGGVKNEDWITARWTQTVWTRSSPVPENVVAAARIRIEWGAVRSGNRLDRESDSLCLLEDCFITLWISPLLSRWWRRIYRLHLQLEALVMAAILGADALSGEAWRRMFSGWWSDVPSKVLGLTLHDRSGNVLWLNLGGQVLARTCRRRQQV